MAGKQPVPRYYCSRRDGPGASWQRPGGCPINHGVQSGHPQCWRAIDFYCQHRGWSVSEEIPSPEVLVSSFRYLSTNQSYSAIPEKNLRLAQTTNESIQNVLLNNHSRWRHTWITSDELPVSHADGGAGTNIKGVIKQLSSNKLGQWIDVMKQLFPGRCFPFTATSVTYCFMQSKQYINMKSNSYSFDGKISW